MDFIFYILIFIIGTVFGSFYTLAVYRIPKREDITHTHSYCPKCEHKLGFWDLIPVWSYIFLGGKCRYCKEKIRPRYFILEALSGTIFLAVAILMKLNIENITIHLEIDKDIKEILSKIKSLGFKRGLSIKPNTDINKLVPYLDDIDLILVMTVEPGLGGQQFLESSTKRLKEIKELIGTRDILLEVDGGINNNTINLVKDANIAVVGSYITKSTDPVSQINSLLV